MIWLLLTACERPPEPPEPDAWTRSGPGAPTEPFEEGALFANCAFLDGGPEDVDHHNLVGMHDGWLVLPWAPEDGGGGVSFFDVSEPCAPVEVGRAFHPRMRETHTLAFSERSGRVLLAVDTLDPTGRGGGVGFWDVTDVTDPQWFGEVLLDGIEYPDAYSRVSLSAFWQGPYLYVPTGFFGVYVVDMTDPEAPVVAGQIRLEVPLLAGSFHVVGDRALYSTAGLNRFAMLDLTDPIEAQELPGASLELQTGEGRGSTYYFANWTGDLAVFARNSASGGGGPVLYDVSDPDTPVFLADAPSEFEGGYAMRQGRYLFLGDSGRGAVYDLADDLAVVGELALQGDLDTVTPIGNVAMISVDSGAPDGEGTAIAPFSSEPDTAAPRAQVVRPVDGATRVAATMRVGVAFDEDIEPRSVFDGSFRVMDARGWPVPGDFNVQEGIVNFTPDAPWEEDTTYVVHLPAGGVSDLSGNPLADPVEVRFSTGDRVR